VSRSSFLTTPRDSDKASLNGWWYRTTGAELGFGLGKAMLALDSMVDSHCGC
jgi:hypothetical protein